MPNKNQKSMFISMVTLQCPQCRESHLYENPNTYSLKKLGAIKTICDRCGENLQPEPGFYFGAAYVSWGLTVALWVSVLVALKVFAALGWIEFAFLTHPATFLITGIVVSIITFPYMFRLSRSIWAHFFIKPREEEQKLV
ncbi:MAG: hypothetical protein ACOVQ5_02260 [Flavobacteriales bacterium]|jgi:hypothetical protein